MSAFEASLLLAPLNTDNASSLLQIISSLLFLTTKTTSQKIQVLRELTTNLLLAINLIGPVFFPDTKSKLLTNLVEIGKNVSLMTQDMKNSLSSGISAFQGEEALRSSLLKQMEKTYVDFTLYERDDDFKRLYVRQFQKSS